MEDWANCCSLQFASLQSVFVAHREGTRIQEMYENVHPNLVLVLLFVRTEVECRKGLFSTVLQDRGRTEPPKAGD